MSLRRRAGRPRRRPRYAMLTALATAAMVVLAAPAVSAPPSAVARDDEPRPQGVDANGQPMQPGGRIAGPSDSVGPSVTRATILARAQIWADSRVRYSQSAFKGGYRTDCSGYVSMVWNTDRNYWTGDLNTIGTPIEYDDLRPGDMLLYHNKSNPRNGSHVVIFDRWTNGRGGDFMMYEQTPPSTKHRTWSSAGYSRSRYKPFRYVRVADADSASYPVTGDWDGNGTYTPGVVVPEGKVYRWLLSNKLTGGVADVSLTYGEVGSTPVAGDWDGDKVSTPGTVDNTGSWHDWHLTNTLTGGDPAIRFGYGAVGATPVVGDWDGDGVFTPGVVAGSPDGLKWALSNVLKSGDPTIAFTYGEAGATPVAGDWDGDGVFSPGTVDNTGRWHDWRLSNTLSGAKPTVKFGGGGIGAAVVVGDWDGDRIFSPGLVETPSQGAAQWALSNVLKSGDPTITFTYDGVTPVTPAGP